MSWVAVTSSSETWSAVARAVKDWTAQSPSALPYWGTVSPIPPTADDQDFRLLLREEFPTWYLRDERAVTLMEVLPEGAP